MTDRLRTYLRDQLSKKVDSYGLVVWNDAAGEYGEDVARSVCPNDAAFVAYTGSWYEVKHQVEPMIAADAAPRLVVYAPQEPPSRDPLAEIRAAGADFRLRLATLVASAMARHLSAERAGEIGRKASNVVEAEAAIGGGTAPDIKVVALLGTGDTVRMIHAAMNGQRDSAIEEAGAWPDVAGMLEFAIGIKGEGAGQQLRVRAMRHMALCDLSARSVILPTQVLGGWTPPSAARIKLSREVLRSWRADRDLLESYFALATQADPLAGHLDALVWTDALADDDVVPSIEVLAQSQAISLLRSGDGEGAARLARTRLERSMWARPGGEDPTQPTGDGWSIRWRVIAALGDLAASVASYQPKSSGVEALLAWYVESGWEVDRNHRRLELALSTLALDGDLEALISGTRDEYAGWLSSVVSKFASALSSGALETGHLIRQGSIYDTHVRPAAGAVALIWVDALRYELGADLAEKLKPICSEVNLSAAVTLLPSITPVGMANLCPDASTSLSLALDSRDSLAVSIGGTAVKTVADRVDLLRRSRPPVANLTLSDVVGRSEKDLAKQIAGASLVLVRSQEIDSAGESGMLTVGWDAFEATNQQLTRAVARLSQAGVGYFVITADHGFVALSAKLLEDRVVENPQGGRGDRHARCWVGIGGIDSTATERIHISSLGIPSELDLIVPAHLAVFKGPWTRQFFHGGASPQEMVIPVITAKAKATPSVSGPRVAVSVPGDRIITGAFSARLQLEAELMTREVHVRVQARDKSGQIVARLIDGEGYDPDTGLVHLGQADALLTFRVTANLARDLMVEIQAVDAASDRPLGSATVKVTNAVEVDEFG